MRKLTQPIALLMLVCWGLAVVHCDLEQVPGLEFLACCQHPDTAPHQDNDCDQDGCAVVESGFYRTEQEPVVAPSPLLVLKVVLPHSDPLVPSETPGNQALGSVPPELPCIWQFSSRAALPPRAPSLVS